MREFLLNWSRLLELTQERGTYISYSSSIILCLLNSYDYGECQEESHCIVILALEVDSNSEESTDCCTIAKILIPNDWGFKGYHDHLLIDFKLIANKCTFKVFRRAITMLEHDKEAHSEELHPAELVLQSLLLAWHI